MITHPAVVCAHCQSGNRMDPRVVASHVACRTCGAAMINPYHAAPGPATAAPIDLSQSGVRRQEIEAQQAERRKHRRKMTPEEIRQMRKDDRKKSGTNPWILRGAIGIAVLVAGGFAMRHAGMFTDRGADGSIERDFVVKIPEGLPDDAPGFQSIAGALAKSARFAFHNYLLSETAEEKLKWVLDADRYESEIREYYATSPAADEVTRFSAAHFMPPPELRVADIRRGLMVLTKKTAATDGAVPTLETIVFFRQTPEGMRLDWHSFIQQKDRTLPKFLADPSSAPEVFRVRMTRRHYLAGPRNPAKFHQIQVADIIPGGAEPSVFVEKEGELGQQIVQELPWTTSAADSMRYATVELTWAAGLNGVRPEVALKRIVCWELLGVGGEVSGDPAAVTMR